ncbi:TPA: DUF551 domain-containing protein [Klebsiella pneumoniae]|nr:DUF551 domain-containing protein [Klebsiella pneumoniae]
MKWIPVKEQLPKTEYDDPPTAVKVRTNLGEGSALFSVKLKFHKISIQGIAAPEETEVTHWQMPQ